MNIIAIESNFPPEKFISLVDLKPHKRVKVKIANNWHEGLLFFEAPYLNAFRELVVPRVQYVVTQSGVVAFDEDLLMKIFTGKVKVQAAEGDFIIYRTHQAFADRFDTIKRTTPNATLSCYLSDVPLQTCTMAFLLAWGIQVAQKQMSIVIG